MLQHKSVFRKHTQVARSDRCFKAHDSETTANHDQDLRCRVAHNAWCNIFYVVQPSCNPQAATLQEQKLWYSRPHRTNNSNCLLLLCASAQTIKYTVKGMKIVTYITNELVLTYKTNRFVLTTATCKCPTLWCAVAYQAIHGTAAERCNSTQACYDG